MINKNIRGHLQICIHFVDFNKTDINKLEIPILRNASFV